MKKGSITVVILFSALAILGGAIFAPIILIGNSSGGDLDKATGKTNIITTSQCVTPLYPPVINEDGFAEAINTYISGLSTASPFVGTGDKLVQAGKLYGINPAWVINIARKESSFGLRIPTGTNNAFGRTATSSQPGVEFEGRRWYKYDSFIASIPVQTEYLKRRYIDEGLLTITQITNVYAPPKENNTAGYINQMNQWIGEIMALAEGSVTCDA